MFSPSGTGKTADGSNALSPGGSRQEFPFHSRSFGRPISSRRSSTAGSIRSITSNIESSSETVREAGQNAISTLLQAPIVRTGLQPHTSVAAFSAQKPPTARDIPPVTLTNVPHVDPNEFTPYLAQVSALYQQLQSLRENDEEASAPTKRHGSKVEDNQTSDGHLQPGGKPSNMRRGSASSLNSMSPIDPPSPVRRTSSSGFRKATQGPPPLSTIPTVYFDEDFHLENPRTFDVVSEKSEVVPPENIDSSEGNGNAIAPRKALATNAILQEKLSWYMDTTEIHLINSISTASTTFFTALGSLKELHSEAADSVKRIKVLRRELEALDEEVATSGLQVSLKRRREGNLQRLNNAIQQLKKVTDGLVECENLVDAGELDKALAGIDSLEKVIQGQSDSTNGDFGVELYDLRSSSVLQGISSDIETLRFRIGRAYESQFQDVLLADLRQHVENISHPEVLRRWANAASRSRGSHARSPSVFPTYLTKIDDLRTQVMPSMIGLYQAKHVSAAATAYRDLVLREVKNIIRRPLPSSNDDDNESMMSVSTAGGNRSRTAQEKSSVLARNLRALEAEDAEELLTKVYVGVTETLRRLSTQVKVLLDIASSMSIAVEGEGARPPPIRSPATSPRPDRHPGDLELQEELHKTLNMSRLQDQAVDTSNEKIVKVLKVRSEQTIRLPLKFFLRYFTLNLYFANECEAISGKTSTTLKNVVNNQIRDFVQKHGDLKRTQLAQEMEKDQWSAQDFTSENTEVLQRILEASDRDAEAWSEMIQIWISEQQTKDPETNGGAQSASAEDNNGAKKEIRTAVIDEDRFMLPRSAVSVLEGIESFMQLISGIPSMTSDISTSLIAYLQLFNSRCTQLILGAGATKSAGLKNITTKHLALASQALAFTATLVPHVREFVRRHTNSPGSLMGEFDKVRRLFQEHQDSIHQKLVDIMSGRAAVHAKSMKAIDWDSSPGPHSYMETLAKETTTLHRVLTKHLPEMSIQTIMTPVFASYKDHIGSALTAAHPTTTAGWESMTTDLELLTTKLGKLEGFGDTGEFLQHIAKTKLVRIEQVEKASQAAQEAANGNEADEKKDAEDATDEDAKDEKDTTKVAEVVEDGKAQ